jgi:hypothetical protein
MRLRIIFGACVVLAGGPAAGADLALYPAAPPRAGSPIYAGQSIVTGDASLALGYFSFEGADTGEIWGTARANIPFGPGLNEEVELSGLTGFEKNSYYTYGIYSHSYWKSARSAAGLLLGGSNLAGSAVGTVGVEGAVFLPSTTFVGLVAYNWANGVPDFWSASGEARWYWNPNTKLMGSVNYNEFNAAWKLTGGAEHRWDGTMVSLFGEGTYYTNSQGTGWEVFAGGRVSLDRPGQTLQGHDFEVPFAAARAITF